MALTIDQVKQLRAKFPDMTPQQLVEFENKNVPPEIASSQKILPRTIVDKAGGFFGKALEKGADFTGVTSGLELAKPAIEGMAILGSFAQGELGERFRQQRLLGEALGEASRTAEQKGTKEGVKMSASLALETLVKGAPLTLGGLGVGVTGIARGAGFTRNLRGFANSFVGRSAELAFADSVSKDLKEGSPAGQVLKNASVRGATNAATSLVMGKAFSTLFNRFATKAGTLNNRALQANIRNMQSDIEKGKQTIGQKVLNEGYVGTTKQLFRQAQSNKKLYGSQIGAAVEKTKGTIQKKDVIRDAQKIIDDNVVLEDSQLRLISRQINKVPAKMTAAQANKFKQKFAEMVPKRAWDSVASDVDSFRGKLFQKLSGGFRKEIERLNPRLRGINEKWAIAHDVLGLTANQLAKRQLTGGLGTATTSAARGGLFAGAVSAVTSPFTATVTRTTRAQILNALSKAGRQDLAREMGKFLIIKSQTNTKKKKQ